MSQNKKQQTTATVYVRNFTAAAYFFVSESKKTSIAQPNSHHTSGFSEKRHFGSVVQPNPASTTHPIKMSNLFQRNLIQVPDKEPIFKIRNKLSVKPKEPLHMNPNDPMIICPQPAILLKISAMKAHATDLSNDF